MIFDPLYQYDYLARPFKIIPNTAAALPQISADGKTWIIKVKPGIYFSDDPVFKGKKRELTAADYVYSWKRIIDPKVRAPNIEMVTDRFVGDIEFGKAVAAGANVYDLELDGMRAIDRYTIQLKLKQPDYDLLDDLTGNSSAAVAREVIEKYGDESHRAMANPVGTGPYVLKEWRRAQKITLEASPTFREEYFPTSDDPADKEIVAAMKGKRIPAIGRIEMNIIEEVEPAAAGIHQRRARHLQPGAAGSDLQRARRPQQAEARTCQARHPAYPGHPAFDHLRILQHGRSRGRRVLE